MKFDLLKKEPLSFFSHEMKTSLSSFHLGLSLLEKDFEKNKDVIPLLKSELEFLNQFICNILDLRWIENKKELLSFEWISFNPLLEEACSGLKIMANNKGISLDLKKQQEIELFADPLWMACVLKNLLSNAIHFSFDKKPIQIKTQYNKDSSEFFCSIKNHSPFKIEEKKVFDLFYTKDLKNKGTGLGLSLVQSVINSHKGQVQAENKGEEVVFSFSLPKARFDSKSSLIHALPTLLISIKTKC